MMRRHAGQKGVSLIEAIVALGVMAFGMLALVGVQATLRSSGDLARQRTEAIRIAQETMENYRAYAALTGTTGNIDFDEIVNVTRAEISVDDTAMDGRLNTTFFSTVTVPAVTNSAAMRPVAVTVDWTDRGGVFQSVELRSLIAGVPPELPGSLALPPARDPFAAPRGRHRNVPLVAFSLPGVGLSVFKPPQRGTGTVGWVFNNATGLVTGLCTLEAGSTNEALTETEAQACVTGSTTTTGQVISGFVRFADGDPTQNNQAEAPTGRILNLNMALTLTSTHPSSPQCYDDATASSSDAYLRTEVAYYCIVYSNVAGTFAGRSEVRPRAFIYQDAWELGDDNDEYKVCRYTPLTTDSGSRNQDHPASYTAAGSPPFTGLNNQNFLVIGGAFSCPSETPSADDLFNANTRLHQDGDD